MIADDTLQLLLIEIRDIRARLTAIEGNIRRLADGLQDQGLRLQRVERDTTMPPSARVP